MQTTVGLALLAEVRARTIRKHCKLCVLHITNRAPRALHTSPNTRAIPHLVAIFIIPKQVIFQILTDIFIYLFSFRILILYLFYLSSCC